MIWTSPIFFFLSNRSSLQMGAADFVTVPTFIYFIKNRKSGSSRSRFTSLGVRCKIFGDRTENIKPGTFLSRHGAAMLRVTLVRVLECADGDVLFKPPFHKC